MSDISPKTQYSVTPVPAHLHTGIDSPQVSYLNLLDTPSGTASIGFFGNGADGAVSITTGTTLTRDMFYSTLVVGAGVTLNTNGFKIFASTSVEVDGTIACNGGNGGNGGNGDTVSGSGTRGNGGTAGTAGTGISSGTLKQPGNGTAGVVGGNANTSSNQDGITGSSETFGFQNHNAPNGGNSGTGAINTSTGFGANGSSRGMGGTITQVTTLGDIYSAVNLCAYPGQGYGVNPNGGSGAGGGGGVGNNSADAIAGGGGGAGSGASGGVCWIASPTITVKNTGTISANGGNGGRGGDGGVASNAGLGGANYGGGGGGGGAGGNGGAVFLFYQTLTNQGSIVATRGTGGAGGSAGSPGSNISPAAGSSGSDGTNGTIYQYHITSLT